MIDRVKGNVAFICDECDEQLDTETSDFTEARTLASEIGWRMRVQTEGGWRHTCKDCSK